ncbi:unnamed protein product [Brachionus calyciflorus]|uniref:Uncharacterized protein n=1 Tax=Brachionus calyciflorus TaxID=104777 RepID=A0A813YRG0_9BILA|nr:unnamed protein product [Brachionus calyciflorus]
MFGFNVQKEPLIVKIIETSQYKYDLTEFDKIDILFIKNNYIHDLSTKRLNKLFKILQEKEEKFKIIFESLNLISFTDYKLEKYNNVLSKNYQVESNNFLLKNDSNFMINEKFIKYLYHKTHNYSFDNPRNSVLKRNITVNKKPAIVTAANSAYYSALQATVFHIHKHFPDYPLIIYDLGLDEESYKTTIANCKCVVKKFDMNKLYERTSAHISNLKTYAWKPLLIQETLIEYETVLYVDSSIRFQSSEISSIIDSVRQVGMLTQYIELKLNCYTNPKMFEWFEDTPSTYDDFFTIEANILLFHRNFLTSLIMKAWVTCALEESCISPIGSRIDSCCGCHRYDQDALTIINSYFYGHPKDSRMHLPPYSFTREESFFFKIRRYEGMDYFKNQAIK